VLEVTRAGKKLDVPSRGTIEASVARALALFPRAKLDTTREVLAELTRSLARVPDRKDAAKKRVRRRAPGAAPCASGRGSGSPRPRTARGDA
jgi:hypothetical protein